MNVQDYMASPVITIPSDTGVQEALVLMKEHKFRRLPILNSRGKLVGIVTERDLLHVAASPATSLSIWELNYLLAKMKVDEVMTKNVVVIRPTSSADEAARLLLKHKIGGIPVVDEKNNVIGVITESDIFRAFIERNDEREEMDFA